MKVNICDKNLIGVLHANEVEIKLTGAEEAKRAI
jgi:lactate racemase